MEDLKRPSKISFAVYLLYGTLLLGIIRSFLRLSILYQVVPIAPLVIYQLFVLFVLAFFIYKTGKRKNWARITFLVLCIVGLPMSIHNLIKSFSADPIGGSIGFLQVIIQLICCGYLFLGPSAKWFDTIDKKIERPDTSGRESGV